MHAYQRGVRTHEERTARKEDSSKKQRKQEIHDTSYIVFGRIVHRLKTTLMKVIYDTDNNFLIWLNGTKLATISIELLLNSFNELDWYSRLNVDWRTIYEKKYG